MLERLEFLFDCFVPVEKPLDVAPPRQLQFFLLHVRELTGSVDLFGVHCQQRVQPLACPESILTLLEDPLLELLIGHGLPNCHGWSGLSNYFSLRLGRRARNERRHQGERQQSQSEFGKSSYAHFFSTGLVVPLPWTAALSLA